MHVGYVLYDIKGFLLSHNSLPTTCPDPFACLYLLILKTFMSEIIRLAKDSVGMRHSW